MACMDQRKQFRVNKEKEGKERDSGRWSATRFQARPVPFPRKLSCP